MASIIDLPDFMFANNNKQFSKLLKIIMTLWGLIIGFIHKNTNGKLFCFFMNLFFQKDGKIYFKDNSYSKRLWDDNKFSYLNKRIDRIIINHRAHFKMLFDTYCLDSIDFNNGDLIIDCGANIGELFISLKMMDLPIKYIGFEPDPKVFIVLKQNLTRYDVEVFDKALSDKKDKKPLYLNTEGADSSLIYFGTEEKVIVESDKLDNFEYTNIKLLKIEAEGGEIEVLLGSKNTLKNIQYISVDYGPERGVTSEPTNVDIINFLYENNFRLVNTSKYRQVGLFKNQLFK
jgi:FkbM family methyltransferase